MDGWVWNLRHTWIIVGIFFFCLLTKTVWGQTTVQIQPDISSQTVADGQWIPLRITWSSSLISHDQAFTLRLRDPRGGLTIAQHFAPGTTQPVTLSLPLVALEELRSQKLSWAVAIQLQGAGGETLHQELVKIRTDDLRISPSSALSMGDIPCLFDPLKDEFTPSHPITAGVTHWQRTLWWWSGGTLITGVIVWLFLRTVPPRWVLLSWFLVFLVGSGVVIWYLETHIPGIDEVQTMGNRSLRVVGKLRPWSFTTSGTGTAPHPLVNSASEWWSLRGEIENSSTSYRCSYDLPGKYLLWLDLSSNLPRNKKH